MSYLSTVSKRGDEERTQATTQIEASVGGHRSSHSARHAIALDTTVFASIALALACMLLWMAYQGWAQLGERQNLALAEASQQQQVDASNKVRQQLDAISAGMQKLADAGNPNAKLVVEELRKRGVTISVPGAAAPVAGK